MNRTLLGTMTFAFVLGCGDPEPAKTTDDVMTDTTAVASAAATASDAAPVASAPPTATATTSAPTASAPPVEEAPALVFEGIKVLPSKPGAKAQTLEVKPDGAVVVDGKATIATFVKNELRDEKGQAVLRVLKDGTVEAVGPTATDKQAKINDGGELVTPDGKIVLAKDGTLTFTTPAGKSEKAPVKFLGVTDKNHRAAVVLGTYLMLSTSDSPPGPQPKASTPAAKAPAPASSSTATPAPTTKPPPKK
ncbi:MAG: hypothetical protein IPM79_32695 [Polyangiaceae bacterium]|nr:hypothetical protein [Polyangiaceae bacterium]MBK8942238.1 hypothetical protein [Polyangiaceae bacterium]